ncbi:MAG: Fic family protein [Chloroflexi bacterium]|nr:Fic family protein [Chloroflexota bacterium]
MRIYETTHSWITFGLDLRQMNYKSWMMLGEAQSKCVHIMWVPLLPRVADELHKVFLAKGALATTAIEGNTLTELEARKRLDGNLKLPPSKEYLGKEIDNVVEACNEIGNKILHDKPTNLSIDDIKHYNQMILKNLPVEEDVIPGEIRKHDVVVGRYKGAPPEDCDYLLEKLCIWLNTEFKTSEDNWVAFGVLKAIIAHVYLAWIHPFGDGNGRTARLIEFQILLSSGVPSTAAHLLSNHYNQTRTEYYRHLDLSHKSGGDVFPFIEYALRGFVDELKKQIDLIQGQQLMVHLINYIHDKFKGKDSATNTRRRYLALDLAEYSGTITLQKIRHITPRIAEAYAKKTEKTIKRDINALREMELLVKENNGYRLKREIIYGFLPQTLRQFGE